MNIAEIDMNTSRGIAQAESDGKTVHHSGVEADYLWEYLKNDYISLLELYSGNHQALSEIIDVIVLTNGRIMPYIDPSENSNNQ